MGEEPKNFHDVAHPGSTPQPSTSRPIIVGRSPMMRDPMMKQEQPEQPEHGHTASGPEPKLTPPTLKAVPEQPEALPAESAPEPASEGASTRLSSSIPNTESFAQKVPENPAVAVDRKVEGLIESKTYAVPVGNLQRKRTMRIMLIVLAVVVVVGGAAAYFVASSM